jgi:hypothetical protein
MRRRHFPCIDSETPSDGAVATLGLEGCRVTFPALKSAGVLPYLRRVTEPCPMSLRTDDYRERARQCERYAKEARDPEVRRQYEELARQWTEMANQADRPNW